MGPAQTLLRPVGARRALGLVACPGPPYSIFPWAKAGVKSIASDQHVCRTRYRNRRHRARRLLHALRLLRPRRRSESHNPNARPASRSWPLRCLEGRRRSPPATANDLRGQTGAGIRTRTRRPVPACSRGAAEPSDAPTHGPGSREERSAAGQGAPITIRSGEAA